MFMAGKKKSKLRIRVGINPDPTLVRKKKQDFEPILKTTRVRIKALKNPDPDPFFQNLDPQL